MEQESHRSMQLNAQEWRCDEPILAAPVQPPIPAGLTQGIAALADVSEDYQDNRGKAPSDPV
jgi:hypothetical protein